jgi:hypothetical protein
MLGTASCALTCVSVPAGVKLRRWRVYSDSVLTDPAIRYSRYSSLNTLSRFATRATRLNSRSVCSSVCWFSMPSRKAVAPAWPMAASTSSSVSATIRANLISSMTFMGARNGERLSIECEPPEVA